MRHVSEVRWEVNIMSIKSALSRSSPQKLLSYQSFTQIFVFYLQTHYSGVHSLHHGNRVYLIS